MTKGRLILFPVPIGAEEIGMSLPAANKELLASCHTFIVEELRTARRFLKKAGYPYPIGDCDRRGANPEKGDCGRRGANPEKGDCDRRGANPEKGDCDRRGANPEKGDCDRRGANPIDDTVFLELNEHTTHEEIGHYLDAIERGENIGLLSEAGLPCVADPGAMITRVAQRRGIEVVPLVGPSSLMLALMASGFNGQSFAFNGYLPVDKSKRAAAIRHLEERLHREHQTQLFIEAPYRNNQMLEALASTLNPQTMICVACDLTLPTQYIRSLSAAKWQKEREKLNLHKRNTVFLIGE